MGNWKKACLGIVKEKHGLGAGRGWRQGPRGTERKIMIFKGGIHSCR